MDAAREGEAKGHDALARRYDLRSKDAGEGYMSHHDDQEGISHTIAHQALEAAAAKHHRVRNYDAEDRPVGR